MMSDGGLCPVHQFRGFRAILSGPAGFYYCFSSNFFINQYLGGVVGYSVTTYNKETKQPVIGFDMVSKLRKRLSANAFVQGGDVN